MASGSRLGTAASSATSISSCAVRSTVLSIELEIEKEHPDFTKDELETVEAAIEHNIFPDIGNGNCAK